MNEARDIHSCETDSTVVTDYPVRGLSSPHNLPGVGGMKDLGNEVLVAGNHFLMAY